MNAIVSQLPPQSVLIGVGLLVAAALIVAVGRTRRVPAGDLMAVFGGCVLVGAAGSRLFWLFLEPSVDIGGVLEHPRQLVDPRLGGHSSFGAMVGAAVVVGLWVRSHSRMLAAGGLDALVIGGLGGLTLARLGCMANGCDFGRPTDWSGAVRYGPQTEAFNTHLLRGWIPADALWSLPVHPFALYLALGTLFIVVCAFAAAWAQPLRPGRLAFWAGGAYLSMRFVTEWARDEATVLSLYGSLNIHHLFAVAGLAVLAVVWNQWGACHTPVASPSSGRDL